MSLVTRRWPTLLLTVLVTADSSSSSSCQGLAACRRPGLRPVQPPHPQVRGHSSSSSARRAAVETGNSRRLVVAAGWVLVLLTWQHLPQLVPWTLSWGVPQRHR